MNASVELVKNFQDQLIKNFLHGDPQAILRENLADDFQCIEPPQMPVGGTFTGWDASLKIMAIYAQHWEVECLKMEIFGGDGSNVVAAKGTWRWTSKETGRTITAPAVELFTVENGKIKSIEVFQFDPKAICATLPGRWRY